jgi:hypothetical protein
MKFRASLLCILPLVFAILLFGESPEGGGLTGTFLLAEYKRLIPFSEVFRERYPGKGEYPKMLGTFNSKRIEEVWKCGGDVCPGNSAVMIVFSGVSEDDCQSLGEPLYLFGWGAHFMGCSPLLMGHGALLDKGFSWSIAYVPGGHRSKPTKQTPREEPLLFDDLSVCHQGGKRISCDDLRDGLDAVINATRSGDSLVVVTLDMQRVWPADSMSKPLPRDARSR